MTINVLRMRIAYWIQSYKHTPRICHTDCFSTAVVVTQTRLNVMLYVHCLPCWLFAYLKIIRQMSLTRVFKEAMDGYRSGHTFLLLQANCTLHWKWVLKQYLARVFTRGLLRRSGLLNLLCRAGNFSNIWSACEQCELQYAEWIMS